MASNNPPFRIIPAHSAKHIEAAKALFMSYTEWLGLDLTFQGFASELQSLPGQYAAPHGELLLAYSTEEEIPIGCVAVRPLKQMSGDNQRDVRSHRGYCEMKRLYVSPEARGTGLGKALVNSIVERAKDLGYKEMRLDTLPSMMSAIQLYKRVGFLEIAPYYETPLEGTLFLGLDLTQKT
ncbi:acyl-CoA N-acyltransferase [Aspergillus pseudotamarii]|uniref:Acyl-CoA N-acyltransferase n=1 Tax=Aspergillus pseudotamarii TaxID=132259 RepID=A0A5N6T8F5_ASPPS|nr:acyl-CoA N-acyltransferase [Aspergillus pseudotamarii]KAE8142536.1 acyl-CoA N-acyltransferase [Aspergillus pseudotamarii]